MRLFVLLQDAFTEGVTRISNNAGAAQALYAYEVLCEHPSDGQEGGKLTGVGS